MAAKVQLNLEARLRELRDLEAKGVFTQAELAEVVRRLRGREAALVRQGTQPGDVLDYAEYEQRLEKLRALRVKRLKLAGARPTVSDVSLPKHVLSLYRRGVRRFPTSRALWHAYIACTLEGRSAKAVSAALTGAVAAHPTDPHFWIAAARYEADGGADKGGGNVDGARKLLLRGLRFSPHAPSLWVEWLRIELGFAARMRARWHTLGVLRPPAAKAAPPDEQVQFEAEEDDDAGDDVDAMLQEAVDGAVPAEADDDGRQALVDGALVRLVVDKALEAGAEVDEGFASGALALARELPADSPLRPAALDRLFAHLAELPAPAARVTLACRAYHELAAAAPPSSLVEALAEAAARLHTLLAASPADAPLVEAAMRFLVDRHAELVAEQPETAAFVAAYIERQWRVAQRHGTVTPALARLRLAQLRADASPDDTALAEVVDVLDDAAPRPSTHAELEAASERPDAPLDAHLALLASLVDRGDAASVPTRLKRIQAALTSAAARELEARWASSAM